LDELAMSGGTPDPNLETVLADALKRPAGTERDTFLDHACGHDFVLRQSVERLIEAREQKDTARDAPTKNYDPEATDEFGTDQIEDGQEIGSPSPLEREGDGTLVGPYQLVRKIGQGGMGAVYLANSAGRCAVRSLSRSSNPGWTLSR
jgi:hypothetical protein